MKFMASKWFIKLILCIAFGLSQSKTNQWSNVTINNQAPTHRMFHTNTLVLSSCGNYSLLFGGIVNNSNPFIFSDETWIFYLKGAQYTQVNSTSSPTPRAGHTTVFVNNNVYLFGGFNKTNTFDDLWVFQPPKCPKNGIFYLNHSQEGYWAKATVKSALRPASRWGHAVAASEDGFFLFGGSNSPLIYCQEQQKFQLADNELWFFDAKTNFSWSILTPTTNVRPSARMGLSMTLIRSRFHFDPIDSLIPDYFQNSSNLMIFSG
jgi:hypothetical protein